MNYPAVFFYALGLNTRNSCHPNKLHRVTSFTCTLLFASWTRVLQLTVGLLVTCSGSRTAKLLGLAASGVSNQQGTVIGDQNVADLLLWLLIYICKQTTCSYISHRISQNTFVHTTNSLCLNFRIFFWGGRGRGEGADAPPISQNEAVSNVNFSSTHLAVCELTVSITQTHYTRTTLFCLHLRKLFSIEDHRTLSPKTMHCVCCFRWCRHVLSWTFVLRSGLFRSFQGFFLLFLCFVQPPITDSFKPAISEDG